MKRCGRTWPARRPERRDLARWVSMKVRCWPANWAKGCRALQVPAPPVHRDPAPAAKVTTATSPARKAASPAARTSGGTVIEGLSQRRTSVASTSSIWLSARRRFWASPMRPSRRSERICSCWAGSKPFSASNPCNPLRSLSPFRERGSRASKRVWIIPPSSGRVRAAIPTRSSSVRRAGVKERRSARSRVGTVRA